LRCSNNDHRHSTSHKGQEQPAQKPWKNNLPSLVDSDWFLSASCIIGLPTVQFVINIRSNSTSSTLASRSSLCVLPQAASLALTTPKCVFSLLVIIGSKVVRFEALTAALPKIQVSWDVRFCYV